MTLTRRLILIAMFVLVAPFVASAQSLGNVRGWCEDGAQNVVTSGLTSTTDVQASYPKCTVTVYQHGAGLATIYSDGSSTPLTNPFTATINGQFLFYVAGGEYDVSLSGGVPPLVFPSPVTYSDIIVFDADSFTCLTELGALTYDNSGAAGCTFDGTQGWQYATVSNGAMLATVSSASSPVFIFADTAGTNAGFISPLNIAISDETNGTAHYESIILAKTITQQCVGVSCPGLLSGTQTNIQSDLSVFPQTNWRDGVNTTTVSSLGITIGALGGTTQCIQSVAGVLTGTGATCGGAGGDVASITATSPLVASAPTGAVTLSCPTCVTSVGATGFLASTGGTTPTISVSAFQGSDPNLLTSGVISGSPGTPLCLDAQFGVTTALCNNAFTALQANSLVTLGSNLSIPLTTLTPVLTSTVTMPSSGGSWRCYVDYNVYVTSTNRIIDSYVTDGSNKFASHEYDVSGTNYNSASGKQWSPVTYANSTAITFTLNLYVPSFGGGGTITATQLSQGLGSSMPSSYMSVNCASSL